MRGIPRGRSLLLSGQGQQSEGVAAAEQSGERMRPPPRPRRLRTPILQKTIRTHQPGGLTTRRHQETKETIRSVLLTIPTAAVFVKPRAAPFYGYTRIGMASDSFRG
jgi:hypothetical protein